MELTSEICEAILRDHFRRPRQRGVCDACECDGTAENPLCGDMLHITIGLDALGGRIECARFEGAGCAASQAGASLWLSQMEGADVGEIMVRLERFSALMASGEAAPADAFQEYQEAAALLIFARTPVRIRCATLASDLVLTLLRNAKKT